MSLPKELRQLILSYLADYQQQLQKAIAYLASLVYRNLNVRALYRFSDYYLVAIENIAIGVENFNRLLSAIGSKGQIVITVDEPREYGYKSAIEILDAASIADLLLAAAELKLLWPEIHDWSYTSHDKKQEIDTIVHDLDKINWRLVELDVPVRILAYRQRNEITNSEVLDYETVIVDEKKRRQKLFIN